MPGLSYGPGILFLFELSRGIGLAVLISPVSGVETFFFSLEPRWTSSVALVLGKKVCGSSLQTKRKEPRRVEGRLTAVAFLRVKKATDRRKGAALVRGVHAAHPQGKHYCRGNDVACSFFLFSPAAKTSRTASLTSAQNRRPRV